MKIRNMYHKVMYYYCRKKSTDYAIKVHCTSNRIKLTLFYEKKIMYNEKMDKHYELWIKTRNVK